MSDPFTVITLGEHSLKIGSGATPRGGDKVYQSSGIALIRSQNVYNNRFEYQGLAYIGDEHARQLENVTVKADDVLLNITGDSVARVCQVPGEVLPARVNQHVAIIRPDPERLDPTFLRFYLVSPQMQSYMLGLAGAGGTRNALTKGMIERFRVPCPPLPEQRAIAHILGSLDDKIELNRRMNCTLEEIARALFKSWFVDFDPVHAKARGEQPPGLDAATAALFPASFEDSTLGPIPAGWRVCELGDLCSKPQYGYTESATDEAIGPKFLRIKDINKLDWIVWDDVPYCPIPPADEARYQLHKGDIVIARMADPGHAALIEENINAVFASYLIRFRPIEDRHQRFLQYWLRSEPYWMMLRARQTGTTRANINAQQLKKFTLVLPSPQVADRFAILVTSLRDQIVANVAESRTLAELRDTLLPKLMSGELRVPAAMR